MIGTHVVCFDAFGTIVEIVNKKRHSLGALEKCLSTTQIEVIRDRLLVRNESLQEAIENLEFYCKTDVISTALADIEEEVSSIRLRPGIDRIWKKLRTMGKKIAVCSNANVYYIDAVMRQLPDPPDAIVVSFEAGYKKPEPEIFQILVDELGVEKKDILFVGDTYHADIKGPSDFGMGSMSIVDFEKIMI